VKKYVLHSEVSGSGAPFVLLHGYLSSSHYFKRLRASLERSHTVIALDLLGFGKSPKPKLSYTYQDHIDAIEYTLEHLSIQKPYILLGHSMGALVALRYAITHPAEIGKLLLFNPPLFKDRAQMTAEHLASARHYRLMLYSRARHALWPLLKLVPRNATKRRTTINFTDTVRMSKAAREGSYHNVIGDAEVFENLAKLTVPTLLVNGVRDRRIYAKNLQAWAPPAVVDLRIVDADHHMIVRDQELSLQLIENHIK